MIEISNYNYAYIIGFLLRSAINSYPKYPEIKIVPTYDYGDFCWAARIDDFDLIKSDDKNKIERFINCISKAINGELDEEIEDYV